MKRYEAYTELQALEKIKEELGLDAVILSIKTIKPNGIFKFFKKSRVEITAAYEDKKPEAEQEVKTVIYKQQEKGIVKPFKKSEEETDKIYFEQQEKIKNLEQKLSDNEILFDSVINNLMQQREESTLNSDDCYDNEIIEVFYNTLTKNSVLPHIAKDILNEANELVKNGTTDINLVVKSVYNKIIKILGTSKAIDVSNASTNSPKTIFFIGPTGVGKTTTIAKLSSMFILYDQKDVGLITADTYRIAAVEQLKTYADILGLSVGVVYEADDLEAALKNYANTKEILLIDTAGRSHKNEKNQAELKELLNKAPMSDKYLVLSMTTKYEDIVSIINTYDKLCEFDIIFTKADETDTLGTILNVCYETGKSVSYITNGQNVPDDIELIESGKVAKALLGS